MFTRPFSEKQAKKLSDGKSAAADFSQQMTDEELVQVLDEAYSFPDYFPVVVIARCAIGFDLQLQEVVAEFQAGAPFTIEERLSRKGNYVSYHVDIFVEDARSALARKTVLAEMPGVLMLL